MYYFVFNVLIRILEDLSTLEPNNIFYCHSKIKKLIKEKSLF